VTVASLRRRVVLAALVALAGCPEKDKAKEDPNVIETVNGEIISRADFESELTREMQMMEGAPPHTLEQIEPMKLTLLTTITERTVLLQAARQAGIEVAPEEVDRRVLRIKADYPTEGFDDALAQGQISLPELKRKTAALMTIEKLFNEQVYPRVAVTEDEIRHYFEERTEEFQDAEQVHAAQIVVKDLEEAKKIRAQLSNGKKFQDLARKYSLSADAKVGGDLGWFPRGVMPAQFDDVAFKLAPGQVSDVVSSEYGFHLFKLLEKKPGRKKELAEVRHQVEEKLLAEKRKQAQEEFVKGLLARADIKRNEQTFASVTGKAPASTKAVEP
jgi:peptidyl-prolyl cis-trans isomerase C